MNNHPSSWRSTLRIIWAVTAKDIQDALRNKNILALLLTILPMVFFYRYGTQWFGSSKTQNLYVYASGNSILVSSLEQSRQFKLRIYPDLESMQQALTSANLPSLALAIPPDADASLQTGGKIDLQAYRLYWMTDRQTQSQQKNLEAELTRLVGAQVSIQVVAEPVYFQPDSGGLGVTASLSLVYVTLTTGLLLIPHLMLEEKQSRTMDALLVSPAGPGHIVTGKALAGLFYCILIIAISLAAYWTVLLHAGLLLSAALVGAMFAVSLGLLMGILIEDRQQLMMVGTFILAPLLLPVFLSLLEGALPPVIVTISKLVPASVILNLVRMSFARQIPLNSALLSLAYLLVWSLGLLAIVAWLVRRQDQPKEGKIRGWRKGADPQFTPSRASHALPAAQMQVDQPFENLPGQAQPAVEEPSSSLHFPTPVRVIWAITSKDLLELVHSKAALSILVGTAMLLFSNAFIPLVGRASARPTAVIYDPGRSQLLEGLSGDPEIKIVMVDTPEGMQSAITEASLPILGLLMPENFDTMAKAGRNIELQGYRANWVSSEQIDPLADLFSARFSQAGASTVEIQTSGNILFPSPHAGGQPLAIALLVSACLLIIGSASVPLLFIEEKEAQTMQALIVSPASFGQIIAGKALAGLACCLIAAGVIFIFYLDRFANPGILFTGALLGGLFAVSVGLFVGLIANNPTTSGMWGGLILIAIFGLSALQFLDFAWPPLVTALLPWLPGSALINVLRLSMVSQTSMQVLLTSAASLLAAATLFLAVSGWYIRRIDR